MRTPTAWRPRLDSPRLAVRERPDRIELWTETPGRLPEVYGERWQTAADGRTYRSFEPARSKLAAALVRGWAGPVPRAGERWLYLGAASGTTASHVADLLGPTGRLYAVERSPRPFARLLAMAHRWPNVLPILADARAPDAYAGDVPIVDGLYADIAQPDQAEIVLANARLYLRDRAGALAVALKTSSMGRTRGPTAHLAAAEATLAELFPLERPVRLDPFYRSHYFVGGRAGGAPPARERRGEGRRGRAGRWARDRPRDDPTPRGPGGSRRERRPR